MALIKADFFSQSLKRVVPINVLIPNDLPDELKIGNERYYEREPKTLYLLHGYTVCCNEWLLNSMIYELSGKYNLAVVMPSGDNSFYIDGIGAGKLYGEYTGRELVSYTKKLFGLSAKREDTFIAGLSMGGFGALRNALKYNHTFSKVAALSSALIVNNIKNMKEGFADQIADYHYYKSVFRDLTTLDTSDSNPEYLLSELVKNSDEIPEIYMACGTEDFLINENREFKAFLDKHGISVNYVEGEGVHDWVYWNRHLEPAIRWMLNE